MFTTIARTRRVILASVLIASALATASVEKAPVARADGPATWWVAASGTAADPAGNGSSCANPSFVGASDTSIQGAINAASAGDEIRICSGTYAISTTIAVGADLTIVGQGATLPILDGGGTNRIMEITTGGLSVSVSRLHFQNGKVTGDGNHGAGIKAHPNSNLTVTDSYFFNNVSTEHHGGAIGMIGSGDGSNTGVLTVSNSSFYRNSAVDGGAIAVVFTMVPSYVYNSTFVANFASRNGAALNSSFANMTASNSTFIDNKAPEGGDVSWIVKLKGSLIAYSPGVTHTSDVCVFRDGEPPVGNVSDDTTCLASGETATSYSSLQLTFFAPWGGLTPTVALGAGSSAIGALDAANCPEFDQRGESRSGEKCDAGAFEYQSGAASLTASSSTSIALVEGVAISGAPTFTKSGFTEPVVYRLATEVSGVVPSGVSVSSTTGVLSGTPADTSSEKSIVITATDSLNKSASARVSIENCVMPLVDGKYQISTRAHLALFRIGACGYGSSYLQTADIAWNGVWKGTPWSIAFSGTYDGGGKSITGLQIDGAKTGFISYAEGATLTNINYNATVTGALLNSGFVKYAWGVDINNVHGTGTISTETSDSDDTCIGGIAGEIDKFTIISKSSFEGTINTPNRNWVGGLVGCAYPGASIESSYFKGSVTANSSVGGLVGYVDKAEIKNSYASGSVTGKGQEIGGIVGWMELDGEDQDTFAITNSYASVSINASTIVGGVVGRAQSNTVSSSFWEGGLDGVDSLTLIGQIVDVDGTQPNVSPTPLSSMKSASFFTTAGWAIKNGWEDSATSTNLWGICSGSTRPFLLWEYSTDPCFVPAPTTTTTTTTTIPSPTTTAVPGTVVPKVSVGGSATFVGGKKVASTIKWKSPSIITGTIGDVSLSLSFERKATDPTKAASIQSGAMFAMKVDGLKPGSKVAATIYSTPKSLGKLSVTSKGKLKGFLKIPRGLSAGTHHVRITMVNKKGQSMNFWFAIKVRTTSKK